MYDFEYKNNLIFTTKFNYDYFMELFAFVVRRVSSSCSTFGTRRFILIK